MSDISSAEHERAISAKVEEALAEKHKRHELVVRHDDRIAFIALLKAHMERFPEVFEQKVKEAVEAEQKPWKYVAEEVSRVLEEYLGDTDPNCVTDDGEEMTEDEIKEEYPLLWCCMQLNGVLAAVRKAQESAQPPAPEARKKEKK